jgi:hypothetical protein
MGLQLLENTALSRGIIRKSACILAEITIRKSQEVIYHFFFQMFHHQNSHLSIQTVPEDPLRQCQRLPTLRAIQHFEKQSCGEAAE